METRSRRGPDDWWRRYANDPLALAVARDLAGDVEAYLEEAGLRFAMPDDIIPIDTLPRTADGELDRARLPRGEARARESERHGQPVGSMEEALATLWRQVLDVEDVGRHDGFFDLGGDSMRGIQVVAQAQRIGLGLELRDLLEHQTIAELAAAADRPVRTEASADEWREPQIVHGPVPLGVPQRRLIEAATEDFFVQQITVFRFECRRLLEVAPLCQAIEQLVKHHDALRIELRTTPSGIALWNAESARATSDLLSVSDLSHLVDADRQAAEIERIEAKLKDATDPGSVAMVRFALINRGADRPQLLLVALHHAIYDPVTLRIFFDDLLTGYEQAFRGRELRLPPKTSSVKLWAERLEAEGPDLVADEVGYWRERLADEAVALPFDGAPMKGGAAELIVVDGGLTALETRTLRQLAQDGRGSTLEEVLLAAVGVAITQWTGKPKVSINVLHHGRERLLDGLDVSRTVGWFTSDYPVILDLSHADTATDAVEIASKELRHVPRNGIGYSILRYLDGGKPLAGYTPPQIMLNYLGDSTARPIGPLRLVETHSDAAAPKPASSPEMPTSMPILITCGVADDGLKIAWLCNEAVIRKATLAALAERAASVLRQAITEFAKQDEG